MNSGTDMLKYRNKAKMAELVEEDFHLLTLCVRMGIDRSFGERTVESLCLERGIDPDTFLLLCEVYSDPKFRPTAAVLRNCRVQDVLRYLHNSHDFYIKDVLVRLASDLEELIIPCTDTQKRVIHKFLADFRRELEKHFAVEEQSVIPYVEKLILGYRNTSVTIDRFEENHSQIHETLSDLKSLIMKSLPDSCDANRRIGILMSIYALQQDLDRHTSIEDNVLEPMVRMIESPGYGVRNASEGGRDEMREELSAREKEILVSVARGLLNKEIADRHNISINTVITHRKNITHKTGIRTVAGLTAYAILNNLIDINEIE